MQSEHNDWLGEVAKEYRFQDGSKALPVLLDYPIRDGDKDLISSRKNARCRYCS